MDLIIEGKVTDVTTWECWLDEPQFGPLIQSNFNVRIIQVIKGDFRGIREYNRKNDRWHGGWQDSE